MYSWWEAIQKAIQHKYLRRYKKNGKWRYVYAENKGNRHSKSVVIDKIKAIGADEEIHAGSSFSAGADKGHLVVSEVKDNQVSFYSDDIDGKGTKGKKETLSIADFKARISASHAEAFRRHAEEGHAKRKEVLAEAKQYGTPRQIERAKAEVARWEKLHGISRMEVIQQLKDRAMAAKTRDEALAVRRDMHPLVESANAAANKALEEIHTERKIQDETHAFSGDSLMEKERQEISGIASTLNYFLIRRLESVTHRDAMAVLNAMESAHEHKHIDFSISPAEAAQQEPITKALQHKYLRKFRKNGKWVYVYAEGKGNRHGADHQVAARHNKVEDHHIHEGASFSAGAGHGHIRVLSVKDGVVTFQRDEVKGKKGRPGKVNTASIENFKSYIEGRHADATGRHATEGLQKRTDILAEAKQYGTPKQIARAQKEVQRWRELHKEQLIDHEGEAPKTESHGIFDKSDNLGKKLEKYMDASFRLKDEKDHGKAVEAHKKLVAAQAEIKADHGMDLAIPSKPTHPKTTGALARREEARIAKVEKAKQAAEKAKQAAAKEKQEAEKAKQERLDKIAASPDGWKEHLRDRGIDPDHPYLKENADKAQEMWDRWGFAMQPPDRPFDSKDGHEKLWEIMNKDMEHFMGGVETKAARDLVARSGLTFSLEKNIPLSKEHAESIGFDSAGGVYRSGEKHLEVCADTGAKAQHTFLHEFAHALDHLSGGKQGFLSKSGAVELKKHLDALPDALMVGVSKENASYYKSDVERVARAMEQFLPTVGISASANLSKKNGYYTHAQLREHADTFAAIAKEIGLPVKPEALARFKDKAAHQASVAMKGSLAMPTTLEHVRAKETGHEWISKARSYLVEGKHSHAIAAVERAKKEHGGKGMDNPWDEAHREIKIDGKAYAKISAKDIKAAHKEISL